MTLEADRIHGPENTPSPSPIILQNPHEFLNDFSHIAQTAKERIIVQSMYSRAGDHVSTTLTEVLKSAKSTNPDITTTWGVDHYIDEFPTVKSPKLPNPIFSTAEKEQKKATDQMFEELQGQQVDVFHTRFAPIRSTVIPFGGRVHSKFAVADNTTWLLEANLDDLDFAFINGAMKFTDPGLADAVVEYSKKIHSNERFPDYSVTTDSGIFLVDAGKPNKSIIRERAVQMVQDAKSDTDEIYFASQFIPTGKIWRELRAKAEEGTPVNVLLSNDASDSAIQKLTRTPNITVIKADRKVHSKTLLVVDKEQKTQGQGLFTSNNLHPAGILPGTGEIGLLSDDASYVQQIYGFFEENISQSPPPLEDKIAA